MSSSFRNLFRFCFVLIRFIFICRRQINQNKQCQHRYKNESGKGVHFGLDSLFDFRIYFSGKSIHANAFGKVCNNEIVQGHGESHEEAGQDAEATNPEIPL